MAKKKKVIELGNKHALGSKPVTVEIPDEAITYIVSRYLSSKSVEGVPMVVGIASDDVEAVLGLFVEWAVSKKYVKDGILFIGGSPIG